MLCIYRTYIYGTLTCVCVLIQYMYLCVCSLFRLAEQKKENVEVLEELQGVRKERKNDGQVLRSEISKLTGKYHLHS